ncbi:MAG: hypothetical protein AB1481_03000 [Candidatus Omnitrophota bacterium]
MTKKRIEIIVTVALILIFALTLASSLAKIKKRKAVKGGPALSSGELLAESADKKTVEEADLKWVRCPFSGKVYSSAGALELKIDGIIWDSENPMASINDTVVRIGEKVSGFEVVDIKKESVTLSDGRKNFEIKLEY